MGRRAKRALIATLHHVGLLDGPCVRRDRSPPRYRPVTDPAGRRVLGSTHGCQIEFWTDLDRTPDEREQAEAPSANGADVTTESLTKMPQVRAGVPATSDRVLVANRKNRVVTITRPPRGSTRRIPVSP